eukprot:454812-Pelagomonas_calceolata.AAC.1
MSTLNQHKGEHQDQVQSKCAPCKPHKIKTHTNAFGLNSSANKYTKMQTDETDRFISEPMDICVAGTVKQPNYLELK